MTTAVILPKKMEEASVPLYMNIQCAVKGCKNKRSTKEPDLSFHEFPKVKQQCQYWVTFCQNSILSSKWNDNKTTFWRSRMVVCGEHFTGEDYSSGSNTRKRLRTGAVPSLHGPGIKDVLGDLTLSPINPPKSKAEAQVMGVFNPRAHSEDGADEYVDEYDAFHNKDFDDVIAEITARFETSVFESGSSSNDKSNVSEGFDNLRDKERVGDDQPQHHDPVKEPDKPVTNKKKAKPAAKDLGSFDRDTIYNMLFDNAKGRNLSSKRPSELRYEVYKLRRQKKRLQDAINKLKSQKKSPTLAQKEAIDFIKDVLKPVQAEFLCSVLENAQKKPTGRRYTDDMKSICLSLFLYDPRSYRNLRSVLEALPSESLLKELLENNPVEEGFLPFVFEALKFATVNFDEKSKYVSLSWDAMSLSPELHYVDKKNDGTGFITGLDRESKEPATQVFVFMIRSIFGDFKQPIGYFNYDQSCDATKLKPIVEKAIELVNETGLVVKALVCDQAGEHQSLYRGLFQTSAEKPFIVVNGCKIYCLFDPPHLLKNVRANLKRNIAVIDQKIVSWKHIMDFYSKDCSFLSRVAPKLTEKHVYGQNVTNMSVPFAAQVLSRTVSGGIKEFVEKGIMTEDKENALKTAEFCEFFNDLFDSLNCRPTNKIRIETGQFPVEGVRDFVPPSGDEVPACRYPLKEPVSPNSLHHAFWAKAEDYIKSVRYFRDTTGQFFRPPSLNGWLQTIAGVRMLWEEMHSLGFEAMPSNTLNQDHVENFFSQVRYRNGHCDVSPCQFRNVYKFLLYLHIMDPTRGRNSNCSEDTSRFLNLLQLKSYKKLAPVLPQQPASEPAKKKKKVLNAKVGSLEIEEAALEDEEEYLLEMNPGDVKYSSYLARRLILKNRKCELCVDAFTTSNEERLPQHSILDRTEDQSTKYRLVASSSDMQTLLHQATVAFQKTLVSSYGDVDLGRLLKAAVKSCEYFNLVLDKCSLHNDANKAFFVEVYTKSQIKHKIKVQNADLKRYIRANREKMKVATLANSHQIKKLFAYDAEKCDGDQGKQSKRKLGSKELNLPSAKKRELKQFFDAATGLHRAWNGYFASSSTPKPKRLFEVVPARRQLIVVGDEVEVREEAAENDISLTSQSSFLPFSLDESHESYSDVQSFVSEPSQARLVNSTPARKTSAKCVTLKNPREAPLRAPEGSFATSMSSKATCSTPLRPSRGTSNVFPMPLTLPLLNPKSLPENSSGTRPVCSPVVKVVKILPRPSPYSQSRVRSLSISSIETNLTSSRLQTGNQDSGFFNSPSSSHNFSPNLSSRSAVRKSCNVANLNSSNTRPSSSNLVQPNSVLSPKTRVIIVQPRRAQNQASNSSCSVVPNNKNV